MDGLESIQPLIGVGNNPFLLEVLANQQAVRQTEDSLQQTAKTEKPAASPEPAEQKASAVDTGRLQNDPQYLKKVQIDVLKEARRLAQQGYIEAAEERYRQFFSYQRFNQYASLFIGRNYPYYAALLEYAWLVESNGRRRAAETFLNQQLLEQIAQGFSLHQRQEVAQQYLVAMQDLGKLPTSSQPNLTVASDTLFRLAKKFMSQGMPELAREMLAQIEVRQVLRLYRAETLSQKLAEQFVDHPEEIQPLLPITSKTELFTEHLQHWGLPYLPLQAGQQFPIQDLRRADKKQVPPIGYYTDLVHPVNELPHDPNESEEREQRDEQLKEYRSKLKPKRIDNAGHS